MTPLTGNLDQHYYFSLDLDLTLPCIAIIILAAVLIRGCLRITSSDFSSYEPLHLYTLLHFTWISSRIVFMNVALDKKNHSIVDKKKSLCFTSYKH